VHSFDKPVRFSIGAVGNVAAAGEIVHFFFLSFLLSFFLSFFFFAAVEAHVM
jgi:hypothetical protein